MSKLNHTISVAKVSGHSHSDCAYEGNVSNGEYLQLDCNSIITDKMLQEERKLEEKSLLEEIEMRKKIMEEQKKLEEEQCYKRLNILLSRSSIYANFMSEKLQKHEEKIKKNEEREKLKSLNSNNIEAKSNSTKHGVKRKAEVSSSNKRCKTNVNIVDVFKKHKMENAKLNDDQTATGQQDKSKLSLSDRQPKLLRGGTMRDYQIEGFEWLKTLFENGVNGILADEMGLGKTIQSIALIAYLIEMGVSGPFFICGPLSTVPNWVAEFKRFVPDVPVLLYHGDKAERAELRKLFFKAAKVNGVDCYPVVVTSYAIALLEAPKLSKIEWKVLVIDEAHRIKNFQCKLIAALKTYKTIHRLLLTGTPLQNNLTELWSLLNFILPEIFNDLQVFQSWFDVTRLAHNGLTQEIIAKEQEKQIVSTIHQILTPFLLRRPNSDVELDLPPKKLVIIQAPMTQLQLKYYTGVLNKNIRSYFKKQEPETEIVEGRPKRKALKSKRFGIEEENVLKVATVNETQPSTIGDHQSSEFSEINIKLTNITMILRKICIHPYLISYPLNPATHEYLVDENLIKHSGKFLVLDILLPELKKRGHKILIFSQFVSLLEVLEDYCTFRNHKYTCLYGTMNLEEREKNLKLFNQDDSVFLFLISTKAGGLGINLTAADTVILFDSDWNPQGDLQAQDRCHRIGQTKPVVVYRLVIPNTIDERVLNRADAKRKLEKVIIQKGRFNSKGAIAKKQNAITREELLELLESSEVNNFVNADNFVIPPDELNNILDRSDLISQA